MSYTTVYRFQDLNGYESVISKANSDMTYEGFGRILLNPGQTLEYKVTGEEQAIVLQQGDMTCWVEYEGVTVVDGAKGQRGNVYDDLPTGYHTTVALPGTRAYLLWGLAGDTKKYKVQFDERYSWLEGCLY